MKIADDESGYLLTIDGWPSGASLIIPEGALFGDDDLRSSAAPVERAKKSR
jgi:hypothetical protein